MYFIHMILSFCQIQHEEACLDHVRLNEMYFSLFDNINATTEPTSDE